MIDIDKYARIDDPSRLDIINKIDKIGVVRFHDTYKDKWKVNNLNAKLHINYITPHLGKLKVVKN